MKTPKGNVLNTAVNASNNITGITDATGTNVTFGYSGGRLSTITDNVSNKTAHYNYTGGRLTSVTDENGYTTTYHYDTEGLLSRIEDNIGQSVAGITYYTSGDHIGKVESETDLTGNTKTYVYDPSNYETVRNC